MSPQETTYCQFCREAHPVTHLGGLPFPMVECPLMPPDRVLIVPNVDGVRSFTWEPEAATQTPKPRYNPDETITLTIPRERIMTDPLPAQEEPDFAVAVRRGLARRRRSEDRAVRDALNDQQDSLVRDELDRLVAESGPRLNLPSGCGRPIDARRAELVAGVTDQAAETDSLTWRHLLEEDFAKVLAASDPEELTVALVRAEARCRQWRLTTAAKVAQPDPEPEQPAEQAAEDQQAMDDLVGEAHLTHYMEGDSTTPLCRFDGGNQPVRGTDRPELVTCDACKTLFESRFTQ